MSFRAPFLRCHKRRILDAVNLARVHLGEAETLAAKVFQRCTYQIQLLVIDNQKAIVKGFIVADGEMRILRVEDRNIGI